MAASSTAIRRITGTKLEAPQLTWGTLKPLATSCLDWCRPYISAVPTDRTVAEAFRRSELQAAAQRVYPFSCHTPFTDSLITEFERFLLLRKRISGRRKAAHGIVDQELHRPTSLLITDWSASLFDGALAPETDGFMDADGMPPWDTWICLIQVAGSFGGACLLSWVPSWLACKVDFAVGLDAASCLSWLRVRDLDAHLIVNGWGKPCLRTNKKVQRESQQSGDKR